MKKVIVIGSGISGLSITRMLKEQYDVEVLEKQDRYGGMIKCDRVGGNLFHRIGGHVFNSRNQVVLCWFWNQFNRDNEFLKAKRNAKILINEQIINYPIENHIHQLPEKILKPIVDELLDKISEKRRDVTDYFNFKDFLIGNFGTELYKLYFEPYNTKIWNTNLANIPLSWLDGKLPMPKLREVIYSNIAKKEETSMVHSSFFYAKENGSQFIADRLAKDLNIVCSYYVECIEILDDNRLSINHGARVVDSIIFCGDVRELHKIIQIENNELKQALEKVSELKSNGTSNVLCETDDSDISWLYLPEQKYKAHRVIYTGNFSPTNNEINKRKTCVVEFSGNHSRADMIEEINRLPGNLNPLAFNHEPNSYVIQQADTRNNIILLKSLLEPYRIFLLGRFAEWEYYNMDKCIEAAMELSISHFQQSPI